MAVVVSAVRGQPTVLAPRRPKISRDTRRFALPMAASVAGVAVVGWLAFSTHNEASKLAQAPTSAPIEVTASVGDEVVREMMRDHQEFSSSTAMPGVAPYIRTVGLSERAMAR